MSTVQDPTQFTTDDLQDLDFLEAVEETIRTRGWTKDVLFRPGGAVCLVGAGMVVANGGKVPRARGLDKRHFLEMQAEARLRRLLGLWVSVQNWNDYRVHDRAEVLERLQAARTRILQKAGCPSARKARV